MGKVFLLKWVFSYWFSFPLMEEGADSSLSNTLLNLHLHWIHVQQPKEKITPHIQDLSLYCIIPVSFYDRYSINID